MYAGLKIPTIQMNNKIYGTTEERVKETHIVKPIWSFFRFIYYFSSWSGFCARGFAIVAFFLFSLFFLFCLMNLKPNQMIVNQRKWP